VRKRAKGGWDWGQKKRIKKRSKVVFSRQANSLHYLQVCLRLGDNTYRKCPRRGGALSSPQTGERGIRAGGRGRGGRFVRHNLKKRSQNCLKKPGGEIGRTYWKRPVVLAKAEL